MNFLGVLIMFVVFSSNLAAACTNIDGEYKLHRQPYHRTYHITISESTCKQAKFESGSTARTIVFDGKLSPTRWDIWGDTPLALESYVWAGEELIIVEYTTVGSDKGNLINSVITRLPNGDLKEVRHIYHQQDGRENERQVISKYETIWERK